MAQTAQKKESGGYLGGVRKEMSKVIWPTRKELGRTKPVNLMDMGTLAAKYLRKEGKLDKLDESEEINACTVKMDVNVDGKTELIKNATEGGVNIISAMGAAGKINTVFRSADISETSVCPLARVMRRRLREIGIEHLPVVYSEERPAPRNGELGTLSFVPGSAGLELAGYVIKKIAGLID